ncbi:hypothetical protein C6N09_07505, partial [Streptococcus agalactiae]
QEIFDGVFKEHRKVSKKKLLDFLAKEYEEFRIVDVIGLDKELIISYLALWILAIFGTNYCNLILFGFIFSNCLLLIKFIEFQPSLNGKIYYIK